MPNFRSAGAEIFDSEKRIGRKENRAAGAKKRPSVIAGLIFLTSYSALSRISRDPRDKSEDDKEEKKVLEDDRREESEDDNYLLVIPVVFFFFVIPVVFFFFVIPVVFFFFVIVVLFFFFVIPRLDRGIPRLPD